MVAVSTLVTLLAVAAWLYALFDSVTCPEAKVRNLQKPLWVLIVVLFFVFGAIAWFAFGRPRASVPFRSNHPSQGGSRPRRVIAPDDDPDFLRGINLKRDGSDPKNSA